MRALLAARNLSRAIDILRDDGSGTCDGFSVNIIFLQKDQEPVVQNIEVAPGPGLESQLDIFSVEREMSYAHCNR